jgi:hypothetical protein
MVFEQFSWLSWLVVGFMVLWWVGWTVLAVVAQQRSTAAILMFCQLKGFNSVFSGHH